MKLLQYGFYSKNDKNKEIISKTAALSRYNAAVYFAKLKQLKLKVFLLIYSITK
jgi:hypothetical protein